MKLPVYLDHNATTPVDPRVLDAMLPYFSEKFGNAASRTHAFGWAADEAVDMAREQVAALIGAGKQEIIFTSGATEACNLALKGVYERYAAKGRHIITCVTEHKAVLDACAHIEKLGGTITYLDVDGDGLIDLQELEASIGAGTILIALMYANNETGVIQQVRAVSEIARRHQVLFFTDGTQAVGKIPVQVQDDGIDLMAFSAHKLYGPKGAGALYVRRKDPRVQLTAQMDGGGHERGMRSGTLNVPGIVGLGRACAIARQELSADGVRLQQLRDRLEAALLQQGAAQVNGSTAHRLPHVTNLSFRHAESEALMVALGKKVALSSGSACTSALITPSYVLKAMGHSDERAFSSLRFSLGKFTTEADIDFVIREVHAEAAKLRALYETYGERPLGASGK